MAFTYTYDLVDTPSDIVRFEIGDTNADGYFLEDEEITSLLTKFSNDTQKASLASIRAIIAELSRPSFTADWLKVDPKVAIDSYRKLLAEKEAEYGITVEADHGGWFESDSTDVTRSDVQETDYVPPEL